jgi:hypothetical protein
MVEVRLFIVGALISCVLLCVAFVVANMIVFHFFIHLLNFESKYGAKAH